MAGYRLTIRHGPKVEREKFDSLEDAVEAMGRRAAEIRAEGGLEDVTMMRTYEAGDRVDARVEISAGGLLRSREAGIDVMGDGELVPYVGGVRKRPLEAIGEETPFDAVARALRA